MAAEAASAYEQPQGSTTHATAWIALTTNVVFKFIDNEFLFRNYALEQIAHGDAMRSRCQHAGA
jgi:hypothetical protein